MIERPSQIIRHALPGAVTTAHQTLTGGASTVTSRADLTLPDGSALRVTVREIPAHCFALDRNFAAHQFELLTELREKGIKCPRPVAFAGPDEEFPTGYLVLEFVAGELDFRPALVQGYADELARIHRTELRCADKLIQQKLTRFEPRGPRLNALHDEIVGALTNQECALSGRPVLCHGDFWPGNIVWSGGQIAAVIDWENALIGERMFDVALTKLDLWIVVGQEDAEEFVQRYCSVGDNNLAGLPFWELRACERLIRGFETWPDVYPAMGRPDLTRDVVMRSIEACATQALAKKSPR